MTQRRESAEMQLDQIQSEVARLNSEMQAKQAVVEEISLRARRADIESDRKLEATRAEIEAKCEALRAEIAPLKELKDECARLRAEIVELRRQKVDALNQLTAERLATDWSSSFSRVVDLSQCLRCLRIVHFSLRSILAYGARVRP